VSFGCRYCLVFQWCGRLLLGLGSVRYEFWGQAHRRRLMESGLCACLRSRDYLDLFPRAVVMASTWQRWVSGAFTPWVIMSHGPFTRPAVCGQDVQRY